MIDGLSMNQQNRRERNWKNENLGFNAFIIQWETNCQVFLG